MHSNLNSERSSDSTRAHSAEVPTHDIQIAWVRGCAASACPILVLLPHARPLTRCRDPTFRRVHLPPSRSSTRQPSRGRPTHYGLPHCPTARWHRTDTATVWFSHWEEGTDATARGPAPASGNRVPYVVVVALVDPRRVAERIDRYVCQCLYGHHGQPPGRHWVGRSDSRSSIRDSGPRRVSRRGSSVAPSDHGPVLICTRAGARPRAHGSRLGVLARPAPLPGGGNLLPVILRYMRRTVFGMRGTIRYRTPDHPVDLYLCISRLDDSNKAEIP